MTTTGESPEQISPEQFIKIVETELKKTRPAWAQRALARLLHAIFPNISSQKWLNCLKNPALFESQFAPDTLPWILGRLARALCEMEQLGHAHFPFLEKIPWIIRGDSSLWHIIRQQVDAVLTQPVVTQVHFWKSFAKGFERRLAPRPQDGKALIVYIFLVSRSDEVEKFKSVRELFTFVSSNLPKEPCPEGVDEVDFEDRQAKWFEKLCHRNLKLRLAKRGRPTGRKKSPNARDHCRFFPHAGL